MKETQPERLLRYLRANPGASSLEIVRDCLIVNTTGRISDLRAAGHRIDCRKRKDGYDGFYLVEAERWSVDRIVDHPPLFEAPR